MTNSSGNKVPTYFNLPREVEALLLEALTLPPEARDDFLAQATDDPALRARVAELLHAHARADANFDSLVAGVQDAVLSLDGELPFSHAGPWKLVRLLGRGGMSAVYLVERDDGQFEQVAAVKLLPFGPIVELLARRFQSERSILARLEHPNLARLLDGGVAESGVPYFVMEYVVGCPIDRYCDEHRLGIEQRIALFGQVLDVVHYAHRNLIVHRDLKPANILVTEQGQVKLLDFGIAKVLDEELGHGDATELTRLGGRPLTLCWASPEQLAGSPVTTASDIYSLGVLLHWLLTGRSPYRVDPAERGQLQQAIVEQPVPLPSGRVRACEFGADPEALSTSRGLKSEQLQRRLRGDLDNIVLTCLHKQPENRYASVDQLADDLDRHRRKLPVRARTHHWRYRAGRFLARHRLATSLATALPLIAIVATAWHIDRLAVERDRAELETQRAKAALVVAENETEKARLVADFMVSLFRQADPVLQSDQELTALELLELGRARINELDVSPALRAQMSWTFARVYETRADYRLAISLYEQALDLLPEEETLQQAELLIELAMAHFHYGELDQAEQRVRQALALGGNEPGTLQGNGLNMLGNLLRDSGRHEEAEAAYREAIAIHDRIDPETQEASTAWTNLGVLMVHQRRFEPAREAFEHAVNIRMRVMGPDHPWTTIPQANLAFILLQLGEYDQALDLYQHALVQRQNSLGERHPRVAIIHSQLGHVHLGRDDSDAAAVHFELAHDINAELLAPGNRNIPVAQIGLAEARLRQGQSEVAYRLAQSALETLETHSEQPGLDHAAAFDVLGRIALALGAPDEALAWHHQLLTLRRELLGEHDDRRWRAKLRLAETYFETGDPAQARHWLDEAGRSLSASPDQFPELHERLASLNQRQY